MIKRLLTIMLTLCAVVSYAADVVCVGAATQVVRGRDTIFVFKDEVHLRSTRGAVDWYTEDGRRIASNTDEIYPDDGIYRVGNSRFIAMKYQELDSLSYTVETRCDNTILHVKGIDDFLSRAHTYSLSYNALAWNTEAWADSAARKEGKLSSTIYLNEAIYGETTFRLCYDDSIRQALGLDSACVEVTVPLDSIKAVKMELVALATARDAKNELDRPSEQQLTDGNSYSGILEVAFYSNPTPAAKHYQWSIYKSSERIVTRRDKDIRYAFSEPGSYRVVGKVNNEYCTCDSMEKIINISESYLRVPNVFTPNGDGKNDEFRVAYRSIKEFHCWVYNRWGKLVYDWTDPEKGWDGTINGRPAAEGAYFYVIRALGTDAPKNAGYMSKISYNKKKNKADQSIIGVYQLSGDINLLRGHK